MKEEKENFAWCNYHQDEIDEEDYEWKGCWGCTNFISGRDFPYTFVDQLAKEFKRTPGTIRRWVRTGKLEGKLFIQERFTGSLPSPPTYHIKKGQKKPVR